MPSFKFTNNAMSVLTGATASGSATITLPSGDGAKFPSPVGANNEWAMLTLEDRRSGQMEILRCTGRSADVLQVTRGQEGTTAQNFVAGATVSNRMTAGTMAALQANLSTFYLGPWATAPTAGATNPTTGVIAPSPIVAGYLYFNTANNKMWVSDNTGSWIDYAQALPLDGHLAMTGTLDMDANKVHFDPASPGNVVIEAGGGSIDNVVIDGGTF